MNNESITERTEMDIEWISYKDSVRIWVNVVDSKDSSVLMFLMYVYDLLGILVKRQILIEFVGVSLRFWVSSQCLADADDYGPWLIFFRSKAYCYSWRVRVVGVGPALKDPFWIPSYFFFLVNSIIQLKHRDWQCKCKWVYSL